MAINLLDTLIINRISAGEVVESPFSIVKELVDNSIDAKANKITIEIKNGGIDQIVVKDNGFGIEFQDIKKAFMPHATSKISSVEDLDAIYTLGFRGEALASISNVSQTTILTKTSQSDSAYSLDVFGGEFGEIEPSTGDTGTKIEINNLFFNTPARRKFLRKPKIEEGHITNIVARYILANPNISFKYVVDGKTIYQTSGNGNLLDAIYCVYGKEFAQNVVLIEKELGNIKLSGYISKIGFSKPNTTYQTLILNSRYVIDETVSKAVYMAYDEFLMPRQFPAFVLNLQMPAADVDVNVHPSKINIKFANPSKIYDLVYSSVKSSIFKQSNPTLTTQELRDINNNSLIQTDLNSLKEIELEPNIVELPSKNITFKQETFSPITIFDLNKTVKEENPLTTEVGNSSVKEPTPNKSTSQSETYISAHKLVDFKIVGQIFNEFIILEKENSMLLLDFHAGHERLNYDKFSEMLKNRNVVIQDLLIPYTQELTNNEINFILSLKEPLLDMGFDIDAFGDNKVIISSIPMQLKNINLKNFIDDLLHDMKNLKPNMNNEITQYLMQKACKSSVKSGDILTEMEIQELLKNLDMKQPILLCPHGRPVITVVTKSQIEKWFKRIV